MEVSGFFDFKMPQSVASAEVDMILKDFLKVLNFFLLKILWFFTVIKVGRNRLKINHPGRAICTLKYPEINMPVHPSFSRRGNLRN
jgi:hypothetical protein